MTTLAIDSSSNIAMGGYTYDSSICSAASSMDQIAIAALIDENGDFKWKKALTNFDYVQAVQFNTDKSKVLLLMNTDSNIDIILL